MFRRLLQFDLTTFLIGITLLCIWLGFLANAASRQTALLELVRQRKGSVVFQHQHDAEIVIPAGTPVTAENYREFGRQRKVVIEKGTPTLIEEIRKPNYDAPPPGPAWLRPVVGDDFFQSVYSLNLMSCNDDDLA